MTQLKADVSTSLSRATLKEEEEKRLVNNGSFPT